MKIISKYKDYYDYLQGIYGIDNNIILDRREGKVFNIKDLSSYSKNTYKIIKIAICNKIITMAIDYNGKLYIGENLDKICVHKKNTFTGKSFSVLLNSYNDYVTIDTSLTSTTINDNFNCPILGIDLELFYGRDEDKRITRFPKLSDFNIASIYPAEQLFRDLYTWIEEHKIVDKPDNRTDIEKIVSAGFDKKTSFRKM